MSFFAVANILTSFCGTLANGLVITACYRNPCLRSIQNTIFFLLAITDISVTSFVQPTYAAAVLREVLGSEHCFLWDIVALLTINGLYLFIARNHGHSQFTKLCNFGLSLSLPKYRYHEALETYSDLLLDFYLSVKFNSTLEIYLTVCIISLTITIVILTWTWTYRLVARHRKAIQRTQTPLTREIVSKKKILRSTVTALAVTLSLLCCYLFGLCFIFLKIISNAWRVNRDTDALLSTAIATLLYLNSLLNPCLVFWRNSSFREEIKNLLN